MISSSSSACSEKTVVLDGIPCLVAIPLFAPSRFEATQSPSTSHLAAIVTHPWGLLGGNVHNNVVTATCLYFQRLGITTCRFDFGGFQLGRGYTQVEQVKSVANGLLGHLERRAAKTSNRQGNERKTALLLVGYSYGALIASSASADLPNCIGVIHIAPPFAVQYWLLFFHANYHWKRAAKRSDLKRLFVMGSRDNFTSEKMFIECISKYFPQDNCNNDKSNCTGAIIKDADHFFIQQELDVMNVIGEWLMHTFAVRYSRGDLYQLRDGLFF